MPKKQKLCRCGAKKYMDHIRKLANGFYKHPYTGPYGSGSHRKDEK